MSIEGRIGRFILINNYCRAAHGSINMTRRFAVVLFRLLFFGNVYAATRISLGNSVTMQISTAVPKIC